MILISFTFLSFLRWFYYKSLVCSWKFKIHTKIASKKKRKVALKIFYISLLNPCAAWQFWECNKNKLAKLRRHASWVHFANINFHKIHFRKVQFRKIHFRKIDFCKISDLWKKFHFLEELWIFWKNFFRNIKFIFERILDFWKKFRILDKFWFLEQFQICGKFLDFWRKKIGFIEIFGFLEIFVHTHTPSILVKFITHWHQRRLLHRNVQGQ